MLIGRLAAEFLTHIRVERRLSPNTTRAYDRDILRVSSSDGTRLSGS